MDKEIRSHIQKATQQARSLLEKEYSTQLEGTYDILPDGTIKQEPGAHLNDRERVIRNKLVQAVEHKRASGMQPAEAVDAFIREAAFTTLNRFVALKMLEARDLVQECVSKGGQSAGFKEFTGLAPGLTELPDHGYRLYIESIFDELTQEIKILFDRRDPVSLLWPRRQALQELLDVINQSELQTVWTEDETIGWIYQYFNSQDERKAMRDASAAPRNSRELAVRNQFFTPRYVVEFLTDNTLGRIWYEMRKGDTVLKAECQYLVRRPNEVFLEAGEKAPSVAEDRSDLSQEELLKQPVYIEHRPKKDPRDLRIVDPACGSGHFLLYTFDLLEQIYEEAWGDPESPKFENTDRTLQEDFETLDKLRREVPKLIMEHNLHGIDIDPRAVQIAALAVWLRAQKTWKKFGFKAGVRPSVAKSNIVTAEPMPGEEDMKKEFTASLKPRVLGQLVDAVFDKMKLAGEAGSLLKIEEEIKDAVFKAKEEYRKELRLRKEEAGYLPGMAPERAPTLFDFADMSDEDFLDQSEDAILEALKEYAERAENGHTARRRLFSDDTARGLSFIDLCRKRYDVVLMNPPFGEPSEITKEYLQSRYENISGNILCAFIEGQITQMHQHGMTGAVIDRTIFIKNSYEDFRRNIILELERMKAVADLGWGVLDANVEVSCLIFSKHSMGSLMFGANVASSDDKSSDLCNYCSSCELLPIKTFLNMPFAAINFDVPKFFFRILTQSQPISVNHGAFYNGHTIKSDVFKRLSWELNAIWYNKIWKRMWNGSEYSPFYVSMQEAVITTGYAGGLENHSSTVIRNPDKHLRPGLCFGKRGDYLDVQILPEGFVLTNEGFGGPFEDNRKTWLILAYINSRLAQYMVNLYCGQHKGVGYVGKLPIFKIDERQVERISSLAKYLYDIARHTNQIEETDPLFRCLSLSTSIEDTEKSPFALDLKLHDIYKSFNESIIELDQIIYDQADLNKYEKALVEQETRTRPLHRILINYSVDQEGSFFATALVSYLLGLVFGRWDIRIALDPSLGLKLCNAFDPLPVCPPGMLVGPDGLPAAPNHIVSEEWLRARPDANTLPPENSSKNPTITDNEYPLLILWNGILVDDPGKNASQPHPDDIIRRMRDVLNLLWKDTASNIEQEACDILGVSNLREYFRKPAKFFQDHIKRYSKSRRKAPIYWQLATPSSSYSIWLYYHRFDRDTFYKVLEYVKSKLKYEEDRLKDLRQDAGPNPSNSQRKQIESQEYFVQELRDFREEVDRIAPLWNPNLNDGVIINFAPLWRLVSHYKPWQKECKKIWDKLVKGEYDWAHLAMHLWPERVVPKCLKDRSLAIAHGLETEFWFEDDDGKMQPLEVSQEMIYALVKERTSPAVKSALQSLLEAPDIAAGKKKKR